MSAFARRSSPPPGSLPPLSSPRSAFPAKVLECTRSTSRPDSSSQARTRSRTASRAGLVILPTSSRLDLASPRSAQALGQLVLGAYSFPVTALSDPPLVRPGRRRRGASHVVSPRVRCPGPGTADAASAELSKLTQTCSLHSCRWSASSASPSSTSSAASRSSLSALPSSSPSSSTRRRPSSFRPRPASPPSSTTKATMPSRAPSTAPGGSPCAARTSP